ncbi:uncharacterized protein LOC107489622 isoform X1 [Arachis duranensis]|uniref:Uncharacterized protein LOC107489622 isoform X1 n=1 Tax=Arachis duranensis TaxID=130453 RepID=A0A6P4DGR2_ARADU|nr:uncharacterized protein LOC107489622 isoform X1 [Arachis duranensis]XP_025700382.1 uncharacterized protein LOC112801692 isoform X1 [Arachis hypogaea]XP_057762465.1 uncharacterized protein LOC130982468 isoform X1 [Arachis stenosperma]
MSKANNVNGNLMEKRNNSSNKESQKSLLNHQRFFPKHHNKVHPIKLQRSSSPSPSLLSSQNSDDSLSLLDENISLTLHLASPYQRMVINEHEVQLSPPQQINKNESGELKRCNWITNNCACADKAYIEFHDVWWGVPTYDDNKLFELLVMSGLLMDYNWTEILKRREILRAVFGGFDPNIVAKMEETEIREIASNKATFSAECRVRCIVDNAKCIIKIVKERGSFSSYIWGYVNHKPLNNKYKLPRDVPPRTPKADTISKDLIKRGFRFLSPVIVYSFMQAAGLTNDHLLDCYRHNQCVRLAERSWRHI